MASVAAGRLSAFGFVIPLPIKGSGLVNLLYLDQEVRIFRCLHGSVTVQKRATAVQCPSSHAGNCKLELLFQAVRPHATVRMQLGADQHQEVEFAPEEVLVL